jgi:hypothetical protein
MTHMDVRLGELVAKEKELDQLKTEYNAKLEEFQAAEAAYARDCGYLRQSADGQFAEFVGGDLDGGLVDMRPQKHFPRQVDAI